MSMETIFFEKKWILHFQQKKFFGRFVSFYPVWKSSSSNFWRLFKCSIIYCGSYTLYSLGTKRLLETKIFEKKALVLVTKTLWPSFSPFIAHQKTQATFYTCSQGIPIVFVWINRSFHWEVRYRWKKSFLRKKNATFPEKKIFQPFFSPFMEYKKPQVLNYEGPKGIVRVIVHVIRSFP